MAKLIPWNDPQALRALADMQRKIAESMSDLACRMIMEGCMADTERLIKMDGGETREAAQTSSPSED